jgi:protein TonB
MQIALSNYKNSHFIALTAAAFLHGALGFWSMMPSNPVVINKQAIRVSFVAPSSVAQKSDNSSHAHKKIILDEKSQNLMAQKTNIGADDGMLKQDNAKSQNTSGIVNENAQALHSAQSDPVFDAAYLNNPSPSYPAEAKRRGIQGKVLIEVVVKVDGNPQAVEIARSSGHSSLDEAAINAVKNWHFIPAHKGSKTIQASVIVPIEFKII